MKRTTTRGRATLPPIFVRGDVFFARPALQERNAIFRRPDACAPARQRGAACSDVRAARTIPHHDSSAIIAKPVHFPYGAAPKSAYDSISEPTSREVSGVKRQSAARTRRCSMFSAGSSATEKARATIKEKRGEADAPPRERFRPAPSAAPPAPAEPRLTPSERARTSRLAHRHAWSTGAGMGSKAVHGA